MSDATSDYRTRERIIAGLLRYGTWLASTVVAAGLTIELVHRVRGPIPHDPSGFDVVKAGVALFILLPVTRVALMLVIFLRERDYAYTAISALVLAIIGAAFLAGL
jgi:uncharacterized membrane protein